MSATSRPDLQPRNTRTTRKNKKQNDVEPMLPIIGASETGSLYANCCMCAFDVTLEPGLHNFDQASKGQLEKRPRKEVRFCPFCGSEEVEAT